MTEQKFTIIVLAVIAIRFFAIPFLASPPPQSVEDYDLVVEEDLNLSVFSNLGLEAQSAYVFDLYTQKPLYAQNENAQLPLASITKLMTALVAYEELSGGHTVFVGESSLEQEGDSGLVLGESWRVEDLIRLTLVGSSNDGAHALASAISPAKNFVVEKMNQKAQQLYLSETYFLNETGLDINDETNGGAFGSARDVAHLLGYTLAQAPSLLEPTREGSLQLTSLSGFVHNIDNTNEITNTIPWLVGSKTGFTDVAGGNLAVVFDVGLAHPVVAVVLGSTPEGRFSDIEKLVSATFEAFLKS